ncbi:MAG: ATP-binding protein [Acidobacteriota bacterium]|nr:ATP-binding protein [Acidobacteriota bacterium]
MNWLERWRDRDVIKAVTGLRRCGKSTLFQLYLQKLLVSGVSKEQISVLNFEDTELDSLQTYSDVLSYLKPRLHATRKNYVFLDEVQRIPQFERLVDGLYVKKNVDVYITGSNAHMLSGELTTFLSGRYVEIQMTPLSFSEYVQGVGATEGYLEHYRDYLRFSSFPYTVSLNKEVALVQDYLAGIFNTVLMKDIVARKGIRDLPLLERVTRFLFDNIGNLTSMRKICDTLASSGSKIAQHTLESYAGALCETFLLYRAGCYDIKGKELLRAGHKFYVADIGLRHYLLGGRGGDDGRILENVVFLELKRRSREVFVGKAGTAEVDFVTRTGDDIRYYQVAASVVDPKTLARELAPLIAIKDHYPKHLITLDYSLPASHNGIRQLNAIDWLLGKDV